MSDKPKNSVSFPTDDVALGTGSGKKATITLEITFDNSTQRIDISVVNPPDTTGVD
jgi:hypothetical protein